MFSLYIKNFVDPDTGRLNENEVKMYDIPSMYSSDDFLLEPKISLEMGKAGSFEFKMEPGQPYYNAMRQMKTIMRVAFSHESNGQVIEDDTIFRGRVLTIDNTMYGEKSVHLEGDLAFLLDSYQEAVKSEYQKKKELATYIKEIIDYHDEMVEPDKRFIMGEVPGNYSAGISPEQMIIIDTTIEDSKKKYNTDSWVQTMNALDTLSSQYGGYWKTRYTDGIVRIDWLRNYFDPNINPQPMKIGSNLIDISNTLEVNNIFTAIIPIGTRKGKSLYLTDKLGRKYMTVPEIVNWYSRAELTTAFHTPEQYVSAVDNFGWIYKTVNFSNADTVDTLYKYAKDWIKNNYHGELSSFNVSAMDLHMAGENVQPYRIGELVNVIYPNPNGGADIEGTYVVMKISYDLYNPENNQYTVGIPDIALNKTYGESKTTTSTKSSSPNTPTSDQSGGFFSNLLGLNGDQEDLKNNIGWKVACFLETHEWPSDGGEADTSDTDTSNDYMDEDDQNLIMRILRSDGIKGDKFESFFGNVRDTFTVGGLNTINSLFHMAGDTHEGETWESTSPIILDGTTGNIYSKKGEVRVNHIYVGNIDSQDDVTASAEINPNGVGRIAGLTIYGSDGLFVYGDMTDWTKFTQIGGQGFFSYNADLTTRGGDFQTNYGNINVGKYSEDSGAKSSYGVQITSMGEIKTTNGTDLASASFVDAAASESGGVITFTFYGPDGSVVKNVPFNMADTQFYRDAVSAAEERGQEEGADVAIDLDDGDTTSYSTKGDGYSQIFTNVTFTDGKWYRFKVEAGTSTKKFAFKIQT